MRILNEDGVSLPRFYTVKGIIHYAERIPRNLSAEQIIQIDELFSIRKEN